ncbi:NADPH-dependent FMN reductase [Streptomyces ficellus]|uniref:FMN reductase (NADPH) n=1 Tax=Streptomyces ficellus TaxID=1977088 RepID=A0A6I6FF44_9ACTN|nr:NADPH-dependent FMN reductase [Streptomyces ficellus]QGV77129.1 FMN reductase (NADPH) [Streptomyces ficellus]
MSYVVAISGSPSADSRTARVAEHLLHRLAADGRGVGHITVRDLPPAELLGGSAAHPALRPALHTVARAEGVVVATPVYKASYSGLVKVFLDLLPQSGLAGKVVLPLVTGGSLAHMLAMDYALRPVLSALGARHIVPGAFLLDSVIERVGAASCRVEPEAELRLWQAVDGFAEALTGRAAPTLSAAL